VGGMNLDEVESGLFGSLDSSNPGTFDALNVLFGDRYGLSVAGGEGNVARTINYIRPG